MDSGSVEVERLAVPSLSEREFSSAGLEHLPYKQRVGGSNPSTPTKSRRLFQVVFFLWELTDSFSLLRLGRLVCAVSAIVAEVYCYAIVSLVCIVKKVNEFPFSPTHPTLATPLPTSAPIPFLLGLLSASAAGRIGRRKKVLEEVRGS